jgi:hypothetical protein
VHAQLSKLKVTGPSLTSATFILAWKRPVATETPAARSRSMKWL